MGEIVKEYKTNDYEIWTDEGWKNFDGVGETIPYEVWTVKTQNGLKLKCADKHIVFKRGMVETYVEDLKIGDRIHVESGLDKIISLKKSNRKEVMYDCLNVQDVQRFYTNGILSHNTQTTAAYIVYYIIFNQHKTVSICANKEATSKEIFQRVRKMFEKLPNWLKPGVIEWNKKSVELDNGCSVFVGSTSSSSISGKSVNFLYIDEVALISKKMAEDFFDSVLPVVAADPNAKIVQSSTPKKLNHFYRSWQDAVNGRSGYKHLKVEWWDVPGRDEAFKEKIVKEKGLDHWLQEYATEFLGAGGTLISGRTLKELVQLPPIETLHDKKYRVYENPINNRKYMVFVDVGEGIEKDDSTCQVIDITELPYNQVAVYQDNTIKPKLFNGIIEKIAKQYNNAIVVIETNSCGQEVANNLNYVSEYENIFYDEDFGMKTTKLTKRLGCSEFKSMIETKKLIIHDSNTIEQISNFSDNGRGSFGSEDGDDLVMPLINFAYWINKKEYTDNWLDEDDIQDKINKELKEELEEFFTIFADDGLDD